MHFFPDTQRLMLLQLYIKENSNRICKLTQTTSGWFFWIWTTIQAKISYCFIEDLFDTEAQHLQRSAEQQFVLPSFCCYHMGEDPLWYLRSHAATCLECPVSLDVTSAFNQSLPWFHHNCHMSMFIFFCAVYLQA